MLTVLNAETQQLSGIVAFTSYLEHVLSLGNHQPIVFNKVILNEGNGYSNNTGINTLSLQPVVLFIAHALQAIVIVSFHTSTINIIFP